MITLLEHILFSGFMVGTVICVEIDQWEVRHFSKILYLVGHWPDKISCDMVFTCVPRMFLTALLTPVLLSGLLIGTGVGVGGVGVGATSSLTYANILKIVRCNYFSIIFA